MYGREKSLFWGAVLSFLSMLYSMAIRIRHALYRFHIIRRAALPCAVISVGNLTLGGTGKTPVVIYLAALLQKRQRHPVVVSRGYGRKDGPDVVVADGSSILVDAQTGGDESVLIAKKLPGVPVVVGRKRYPTALEAIRRFNADIVVLDDGFQHYQLKRNLDIVLVDAKEPFGNGKLFPAGILREPITTLKRAGAILITRVENGNDLEPLKKTIRLYTQARIFSAHQTPLDLVDGRTGEAKPLSALRGSRVLAFSGIAKPASFTSLLKSLGAVIAAEFTYPDHYDFTESDLANIFKKAADEKVSMVITTEKDTIRLKKASPDGIWALRIEMAVVEREAWDNFIMSGI